MFSFRKRDPSPQKPTIPLDLEVHGKFQAELRTALTKEVETGLELSEEQEVRSAEVLKEELRLLVVEASKRVTPETVLPIEIPLGSLKARYEEMEESIFLHARAIFESISEQDYSYKAAAVSLMWQSDFGAFRYADLLRPVWDKLSNLSFWAKFCRQVSRETFVSEFIDPVVKSYQQFKDDQIPNLIRFYREVLGTGSLFSILRDRYHGSEPLQFIRNYRVGLVGDHLIGELVSQAKVGDIDQEEALQLLATTSSMRLVHLISEYLKGAGSLNDSLKAVLAEQRTLEYKDHCWNPSQGEEIIWLEQLTYEMRRIAALEEILQRDEIGEELISTSISDRSPFLVARTVELALDGKFGSLDRFKKFLESVCKKKGEAPAVFVGALLKERKKSEDRESIFLSVLSSAESVGDLRHVVLPHGQSQSLLVPADLTDFVPKEAYRLMEYQGADLLSNFGTSKMIRWICFGDESLSAEKNLKFVRNFRTLVQEIDTGKLMNEFAQYAVKQIDTEVGEAFIELFGLTNLVTEEA